MHGEFQKARANEGETLLSPAIICPKAVPKPILASATREAGVVHDYSVGKPIQEKRAMRRSRTTMPRYAGKTASWMVSVDAGHTN